MAELRIGRDDVAIDAIMQQTEQDVAFFTAAINFGFGMIRLSSERP